MTRRWPLESDMSLSAATHHHLPHRHHEPPPPVSACFLVRFDNRIGYSIAWKRTLPGLELDGVEYKSLPSGLHNVDSDLLYFIHNGHAGISIFTKSATTSNERNASFIAVGVLLHKGHGRLGQAWLHTRRLRDLSRELLESSDDFGRLNAYWEEHGRQAPANPESIAAAEWASITECEGDAISPYHPVQAISHFLDAFGPLAFPLYREALLRRRILFFQQPPLQRLCEFGYILSVLSSIPSSTNQTLPRKHLCNTSSNFAIGIHEISKLEQDAAKAREGKPILETGLADEASFAGWVACSSDEILATKPNLSDVQVKMPKTAGTTPRQWPLAIAEGQPLKASQRDLRRYIALRQGLLSLRGEHQNGGYSDDDEDDDLNNDNTRLLSKSGPQSLSVPVPDEASIVEPQSWAIIAYDSYVWWASAGEKSSELQEEYDYDTGMLLTPSKSNGDSGAYAARMDTVTKGPPAAHSSTTVPGAVVTYFQRLTTNIFTTLAELVEGNSIEDRTSPVPVSKEDLVAMGLDPWSRQDRLWVVSMLRLYFDREAQVQLTSVECCGVRIY